MVMHTSRPVSGKLTPMDIPILRFGHPVLNRRAASVDLDDPSLEEEQARLVAALAQFQARHGWGRAISAPQIGIEKRFMAVTLESGPQILLNPEIVWASDGMREVWDDCMSLPEIAVRVSRHESISVSFMRPDGSDGELDRVPFDLSELLQHELDHLDGILMTQRMVTDSPIVAREMRDQVI